MSVKLSPMFNNQIVDENGNPAAGWKIHTYVAGSVDTPLAAYVDSDGEVAHANPIILDALGFPMNGQIWLTTGSTYKLVLTDENDVVKETADNISGVNDASIATSQWQPAGLTPTYVTAASFTVAGDQTSEFHVGRRLQLTVTSGVVYGTVVGAEYASSVTTVRLAMEGPSVLDSGLSGVNLSFLRADSSALPRNLDSGFDSGNLLINSNFNENVRAVSGTVTLAAGAYGHDRFKAGASGCTYTFTKTDGVTTLTITAGSLQQVIEGDSQVFTDAYTLQWTGTAQGRINGGTYGSSGITATLIGGANVTVEWGVGTLSQPHFRRGTPVLPWSPYGGIYGSEKQACIRYARPFTAVASGAYSAAGSAAEGHAWIAFDPPMRAAPTITVGTLASVNISTDGFSNTSASGTRYSVTQGAAAGNFNGQRTGNLAVSEL